ncbi:P-loop NTPase fold protein [Flavobacterium sp. RHBU_3]|uniref:KAP family P-loop NTPase fold protein n=1 Tax=Flavobacterium sp. RHBU_3 TaxID=3391184 RepID=UPI0039856AEF
MATVNLLNNLHIDNLTYENDHLGLIKKGNIISSFLKENKNQFGEIKMFALYGEWGSGKSTLMKYIEKKMGSDFNTCFFEAWKYEKDSNLILSLFEEINTKNEKGKFFTKGRKFLVKFFTGLAKALKFELSSPEIKIGDFIKTGGAKIEFDSEKIVENILNSDLSFREALKEFQEDFIEMENELLKVSKKKFNIVLIDDLDRCEPNQILNLLSAVKLFFTYGKKTVFFCGIDKKAVEEAVRTKYGEVVKSNEYLEKIFDISFTMPINNNILPLITNCFGEKKYDFGEIYKNKEDKKKLQVDYRINDFLSSLNFTNPRKVKKVLNKYMIFVSILVQSNSKLNIHYKDKKETAGYFKLFSFYI